MQVFDDRFQAVRMELTLLGNGHQKPALNLPVPNVLLMMGREDARKM
jgi:hypothetical protein